MTLEADIGTVHVVPLNDLREHQPSTTCWCKPRSSLHDYTVYIHNALDQREKYESGELKEH
jgi:hypothetical protein